MLAEKSNEWANVSSGIERVEINQAPSLESARLQAALANSQLEKGVAERLEQRHP